MKLNFQDCDNWRKCWLEIQKLAVEEMQLKILLFFVQRWYFVNVTLIKICDVA